MRSKEYDAFGPWVCEIKEAEDIPGLYRQYPLNIENSLIMIKIPRKINRRDVTPGMDLYDYILDVGKDRIVLLKRTLSAFEEYVIDYADIKAIVNSVDVLNGTLTFFARGHNLTIPYNGCSEEMIRKVTNIIREKYLPADEAAAHSTARKIEPIALKEDTAEYAMRSYHKVLMQEQSDLSLIASQNRHRLTPVKNNIFKAIFTILFPIELTGALYYYNGSELVILSRSSSIKKSVGATYAVNYTYLPLANIVSIRQNASGEYKSVVDVEIETAAQAFQWTFDTDNAQKEILTNLMGA